MRADFDSYLWLDAAQGEKISQLKIRCRSFCHLDQAFRQMQSLQFAVTLRSFINAIHILRAQRADSVSCGYAMRCLLFALSWVSEARLVSLSLILFRSSLVDVLRFGTLCYGDHEIVRHRWHSLDLAYNLNNQTFDHQVKPSASLKSLAPSRFVSQLFLLQKRIVYPQMLELLIYLLLALLISLLLRHASFNSSFSPLLWLWLLGSFGKCCYESMKLIGAPELHAFRV